MNRDKNIDNLRGLAMLAMIVIHATSYFLRDKISFYIWDSLQWAVPVFLFCSFYLYYTRVKEFDKKTVIPYLKKRFYRLIIPYYIFLLAYFPLIYFFEAHKFNLGYILSNIFLYGGLDLNWLPLLFLYFSFLMPLSLILKRKKFWFNFFATLTVLSSIIFIFYSPVSYRMTMWLPWSLLIFFTLFFIKEEKNWQVLFTSGLIFLTIFILTRALEVKIGHGLTQYDNKYPPTIYHLSYGIVSIITLFWLSKNNIFTFLGLDKLLNFFSINSYSLFFVHNLVIFILTWKRINFANWLTFFLAITGISLLTQIILNKLSSKTFWLSFSKRIFL